MKLEDEINQKKFTDEWAKVAVNVIYTGNWLSDIIAATLKPYKINEQHFNILRILRGCYPNSMCPGEMKEVLINKKGDLTRLLDKLVKMDYVERYVNDENRRMVNLKIKNNGLSLLKQLDEPMKTIQATKKNLTEEEAKILNGLLDKLRG